MHQYITKYTGCQPSSRLAYQSIASYSSTNEFQLKIMDMVSNITEKKNVSLNMSTQLDGSKLRPVTDWLIDFLAEAHDPIKRHEAL